MMTMILIFFPLSQEIAPFFYRCKKNKQTSIFTIKFHLDNIVTGLVGQQHLDHSMTQFYHQQKDRHIKT